MGYGKCYILPGHAKKKKTKNVTPTFGREEEKDISIQNSATSRCEDTAIQINMFSSHVIEKSSN